MFFVRSSVRFNREFAERLPLLGARVADPDPVGSGVFAWIRIRIRFSNSLDPDLVSAQILKQK